MVCPWEAKVLSVHCPAPARVSLPQCPLSLCSPGTWKRPLRQREATTLPCLVAATAAASLQPSLWHCFLRKVQDDRTVECIKSSLHSKHISSQIRVNGPRWARACRYFRKSSFHQKCLINLNPFVSRSTTAAVPPPRPQLPALHLIPDSWS